MAKQTLPVNFEDDILDPSMDGKRRYRLIENADGTYSLEDVTDYTQVGSNFGAAQINATNTGVNNSADIADIIDDLDDIAANVTPGKMAGALAVKQLNDNFNIEEVQISLNISDFTLNTTWVHKQGKQVIIYPYVTGKPTKGTTIATGFPIPLKQVNIRDAGFGIVTLDESGRLYISSAAVTTSSYFIMPLSYFTE